MDSKRSYIQPVPSNHNLGTGLEALTGLLQKILDRKGLLGSVQARYFSYLSVSIRSNSARALLATLHAKFTLLYEPASA